MDKKRIITGILIGLLITFLFFYIPAAHPLTIIFLLSICGISHWEFYSLLQAGGLPASRKWGTTIGLIFCLSTWAYMLNEKSDLFRINSHRNTFMGDFSFSRNFYFLQTSWLQ